MVDARAICLGLVHLIYADEGGVERTALRLSPDVSQSNPLAGNEGVVLPQPRGQGHTRSRFSRGINGTLEVLAHSTVRERTCLGSDFDKGQLSSPDSIKGGEARNMAPSLRAIALVQVIIAVSVAAWKPKAKVDRRVISDFMGKRNHPRPDIEV